MVGPLPEPRASALRMVKDADGELIDQAWFCVSTGQTALPAKMLLNCIFTAVSRSCGVSCVAWSISKAPLGRTG